MTAVRAILPSLDALLSRHGDLKICEYISHLDHSVNTGFQSNEDAIAEIGAYTTDTLGPELGHTISDELREMPQVLTANHHGIDTFAQSTQTNLMFSMRKRADGTPVKTTPVLACGSVPLNNLTYPRGLIVYASLAASADIGICKIPLFPDSYKRKLVSVAGPFSDEMIARSRLRAGKLMETEQLSRRLEPALNAVFDDFSSVSQRFDSYSKQATVVNQLMWRRLFQADCSPAELVYIELEIIVTRLLHKDLFDQSTICHQLFFDPVLRGQLIENLDGKQACWKYESLVQRCSGLDPDDSANAESAQGTMFFWGVDAKGRKIPLCLIEADNASGIELRGKTDKGQLWSNPFTPEGIAQGLQEGRLLPSIFTSYLLLAIARGINCIGGYYQADYLPVMKNAVADILRGSTNAGDARNDGDKPSSDLYLSGMQTIGLRTGGRLLPAGPLEIIASGGLSAEQYHQIGDLTVLESHIASLYDTILDAVPRDSDLHQGGIDITNLVDQAVGNRILSLSLE